MTQVVNRSRKPASPDEARLKAGFVLCGDTDALLADGLVVAEDARVTLPA
jgi:hypothetical protein